MWGCASAYVCVSVCIVCVCVCVSESSGRQTEGMAHAASPGVVHHLSEEKLLNWTGAKRHLNQTRWQTVWERIVTKNQLLCLFSTFYPAEAVCWKEKKNNDNVCKWLDESVFILIEQCYLTEVSFRYSPGKWMCEVFLFKKHSCLY